MSLHRCLTVDQLMNSAQLFAGSTWRLV